MTRRRALLTVAVLLAAVLALAARWLLGGLPQRSGTAVLLGLEAPVLVHFDTWGTPHVEARVASDLAPALGFLHANDRFFQMELARRSCAGRLSELRGFGEKTLERDRTARLLRLRATAERLVDAAAPPTRLWLAGYARGVNAWLAQHSRRLPPDLRLVTRAPEAWTAADSECVFMALAYELSFFAGLREDQRLLGLKRLGQERVLDLIGRGPLAVPAAILPAAASPAPGRSLSLQLGTGPSVGSNAWVVAASRSATHSPLLANDPHLPLALPATWYEVQLRSPELTVAGLTIPGLPVVVIGHNADLAWGLTHAQLDDFDLFLEHLDPGRHRVERDGRWEPITESREIIRVDGGADREIVLRSTDRGPLLDPDSDAGIGYRSLTWAGHEAADPLGAFLHLASLARLEDLGAAIAGYAAPAQNLLVAHRNGDRVAVLLGWVPRRRQGDGAFPAPGWDSRFGWDGYLPTAENPQRRPGPEEALVSANDDPRPPGDARALPGDFDHGTRARRIRSALAERASWDAAAVAELQADCLDGEARELIAALPAAGEGPPKLALEALQAWDARLAGQGPAALYRLFLAAAQERIFADEAKAARVPPFAGLGAVRRAILGELSQDWFEDVLTPEHEGRDEVLLAALGDAWQAGLKRWGLPVAAWPYGEVHSLRLSHPLGGLPILGSRLERGPFPAVGSESTIAAFSGPWFEGHEAVRVGPAGRWVVDLSNPDRSRVALLGGQAGHPFDRHYADQLPGFLVARSHPAAWSPEAVAAATVQTLRLVPE